MFGRQNAATKSVNYPRIRCCKGLPGFFTAKCPLSFSRHAGLLCAPGHRLRTRCAIGPILQHIQTGQQKPRGEVSPVDAAIDDCRTSFHSLRFQGFCQLPVAPVAGFHPALYQQARFEPPVLHGLRLRLPSGGLGVKREWTTNSVHIESALFYWASEGQFESILSHPTSSWLYLCPNQLEVRTNA